MALQIDSYITTPIAVAAHAPEPFVDSKAPHSTVTTTSQARSGVRSNVQVSAPAKITTDAVTLSLSARIHLLKNQGNSDNQIAIALNVDTATVASYLDTTATVTASASAPIPTASAIS